MERLSSGFMACCSPACSLAQQQLRRPHRRADGAVAAKRGKRSQGGGSSGPGPGLLQIEPDGANVWRLSAAVDSIQGGGVCHAVQHPSCRCCTYWPLMIAVLTLTVINGHCTVSH